MTRKRLARLAMVLLLLNTQTAVADKEVVSTHTEQRKLQDFGLWLEQLHSGNEVSGTFLFARNGNVVFSKTLGNVHPEQPGSLKHDSSFNIGSVSKSFAAMAIMLLKQRSKLHYDDRVQQHLSTFPYPGITIRHLLTHSSGMVDYEELTDEFWSELAFSNQDMLKLFADHKPALEFAPGTRFEYSNTGYVVLAALVEAITKQSLEAFSKAQIFEPLAMKNTRIFTVMSQDLTFPNRVFGQRGNNLFDLYHIEGVTGDGGVYSTTLDLLKWHNALVSNALLPKSELEEAFKPFELTEGSEINYGFGWIVSSKHPGMAMHDGSWLGFRAFLSRNEKRDELMIFLTNNTEGVGFSRLRNRFLSSVDTELIFTKGDFSICQSKAFEIHCDDD